MLVGSGLMAVGSLVTMETFVSMHVGSSGPVVAFSWEDISTSVALSEEQTSSWGTVEDAARRARTWLLRSRGFGELDIVIGTLT